jgi:hypothetical protein
LKPLFDKSWAVSMAIPQLLVPILHPWSKVLALTFPLSLSPED